MKLTLTLSLFLATASILGAQIFDNATGRPASALAPLGLYDIYGAGCSGMASYELTDPGNLPTTLSNCQVSVDGNLAGLLYVGGGKVTFQFPLTGSMIIAGAASWVTGGEPGQGFTGQVTTTPSSPSAYTYSGLNGVAVPYLVNATLNAVQGSKASPLIIDAHTGGEFIVQLNGAGAVTSFDANPGPVPAGVIAYGFCNITPTAAIDSTPLTIATEPDGNGVLHPACKQNGATIQAIFFLPTSPIFNTLVAHVLTIGGNHYPLWVKYHQD